MCVISLSTWEAIAAIGTWVEAAALVAIFVWDRKDAKEQHNQTLEQLGAAKDAAAAALLNAQAAIAAERAWVVVTPKMDSIGAFFFDVVNKGRAPAKIESVHFSWTFDSYNNSSRKAPLYANKVHAERNFLEQDAGFMIAVAPNPRATIDGANLTQRVVQGNQFLIYDGKITYRDAFEQEGAERVIHETVWCYYFDIGKRASSGSMSSIAIRRRYPVMIVMVVSIGAVATLLFTGLFCDQSIFDPHRPYQHSFQI